MLLRALLCCIAGLAWAQDADTVLVNGKILTVDSQNSTRAALAIRGGRVVALGGNEEMRKLAGARSRVIDLEGRTVIPGLIDAHMHAIRAGQTFSTEVNWVGATSVAPYSTRARDDARVATPLAWDEVTPQLDPGQFTLRTVPQRDDPWDDFFRLKQRLPG